MRLLGVTLIDILQYQTTISSQAMYVLLRFAVCDAALLETYAS